MVIETTVRLPDNVRRAVQELVTQEGDANTVVLRVLEEYISNSSRRRGRPRASKYQKLVKALSTPIADRHLSARPASALQMLKIRYVYELVQQSPLDLFRLPNLGQKSLLEVRDKLATLGLTLGMTLEDESYHAAVAATVAAKIQGTEV
jgi:DNA-directed RNA polymerase alpha subunit